MDSELEIQTLDELEGSDYERAIAGLLETRGFTAMSVPDRREFGADFVARLGSKTYAVRVKRSMAQIDHRAVQEVLGGSAYVGATAQMVVANAPFSNSARALAERASVELIDRNTLKQWMRDASSPPTPLGITPRPHQEEALKRLRALRAEGETKALVVMASGLGKTYLSALDVAQFEAVADGPARVLYLSHQSVILEQARRSYGRVFGSARRYGRFDGEVQDRQGDLLFATFQSVHQHLNSFGSEDFDYVVIDEAHHVAARTRAAVVRHFRPRFMLGLTATDFRADGQDIYAYYNDVVAASLPLERALVDGLLTPIDFRGFSDPVDRDELAELGTLTRGRRNVFAAHSDATTAETMLRTLDAELNGERRTLVFCSSLAQMDRYERLIPNSRTISGRDSRREQVAIVEAFNEGDFDVLLSRDVLNEGIDVPHANALIFLRNTESPVVFLQQLGRGLRKIEGKQRVLVLDFINTLDRVEFIYSFFSRIHAATAGNGRSHTSVPPSRFELDETSREIIRILMEKKIEGGLLIDLHGLSGALDFEVSPATLRHIARTGRVTPDFVEPGGRTSKEAMYFTHATVRKFMRQVHSDRRVEGLLSMREFAGLTGESEAALRRSQRLGELPASWLQRHGKRTELYFTEADFVRHRTRKSVEQEIAILAGDADDREEKLAILSLLEDLVPTSAFE